MLNDSIPYDILFAMYGAICIFTIITTSILILVAVFKMVRKIKIKRKTKLRIVK